MDGKKADMIHSILLFILLITVSCAGTIEKRYSPEPRQRSLKPSVLPKVSGDINLDFIGTLGDDINIKSPWGISFGIDGTLYLCDRDKSSIIRLDSDGNIVSQFSGFDSRTERIFLPIDISVSGGIEIYVLDSANSRVLRFDRNLKNAYAIYQPDSDKKRFFGTFNGLAFDKISGDIFITDRDNSNVIRIDMLGGNIHTTGEFGSEKLSLREPAGMDVANDGTIFIADREYGAVAILPHFGAELTFIGEDTLEAPIDVAVLSGDLIAVADKRGVLILNRKGIPQASAGFGVDREMTPRSVAFFEGNLYISDARSGSILVYKIEKIKI